MNGWVMFSAIQGVRRASNLHECYRVEPTTETFETEAIDKSIIEFAAN